MSLNSVNTNIGAQVALASLNQTQDELSATQKRISTGYRVSDAVDDGAAFAVAQRVRADVAATTSANEQLGGAQGLLNTATSALTQVSDALSTLQANVLKLADTTLSATQKQNYQTQIKQTISDIKNYIDGASYNGNNILKSTTTNKVTQDGHGGTYNFSSYNASASVYAGISTAANLTATAAAAAITNGGIIGKAISRTLTQLNKLGSYTNHVTNQISYNNSIIDAQNTGLGALVDADLAKESANLQALQIRQQLGTQALSIANQAPQALLKLFNG